MNLIELYDQATLALGEETGATDTLLHVHAGMAILFVARVISRRSLATWVPFSAVLLAALANEVLDRFNNGAWLLPDSILDVINTIFWPLMLMVGLRIRRARGARDSRAVLEEAES